MVLGINPIDGATDAADDAVATVTDVGDSASDVGGDFLQWERESRENRWETYENALLLGGDASGDGLAEQGYNVADQWTFGLLPGGEQSPGLGEGIVGGSDDEPSPDFPPAVIIGFVLVVAYGLYEVLR